MTQRIQDLRVVAGSLDFEIAMLQKGRKHISAMEVIGNRAAEAAAVRQELTDLYGQIQLLNNLRTAKQAELAKLNGTSAPTPVEIGTAEWANDEGVDNLTIYAKALAESVKALEELVAAHRAKDAAPVPTADTRTMATPEDGEVLDGRG